MQRALDEPYEQQVMLDSKGRPRRPPRLQYINSINQRHISGAVGTVGSFSAFGREFMAGGGGGLIAGGGGFSGGRGGGGVGGHGAGAGGDLEAGVGGVGAVGGVGGNGGSVAGAATVTVTAESLAAAIARKKHTEMERDVGRALLEASLQKRAERARSVSESQYEQDELVGCVEVTP